MGLGTKVVDRTKEDYPRVVNLDQPKAIAIPNVDDRHKYSQHYLDGLDFKNKEYHYVSLLRGFEVISNHPKKAVENIIGY